jgi:hypothetical protein
MCNVCVADEALKKNGIKIDWRDDVAKMAAPKRAKIILFRAHGQGRKDKNGESPAVYTIMREGETKPAVHRTACLANIAGLYGFDVRWPYVPKPVRDFALGKRKLPTVREMRAYYKEKLAA